MGILAYIVISFVLSMVAAELLRPDPPAVDPLKEPDANNAHVRGTMLPILLGYNKVSPIIGYVGNRVAWNKKVGSVDGGMFHSDKPINQVNYRESGVHFLCIGPAYRLNKIVESGNVIFDQEITRASNPSGSEFTCSDEGKSVFRIYWGEDDQPIDTDLAEITGVATRYPFTCYIHWVQKDLGQQASWSSIEYYLECSALGAESEYIDLQGPSSTVLLNRGVKRTYTRYEYTETFDAYFTTTDASILDFKENGTISIGSYKSDIADVLDIGGGTYKVSVQEYPPTSIEGDVSSSVRDLSLDRRGVNPASAITQLLFDDYPHGLGMNTSAFSLADLNTIKAVFAETGSETAPSTSYNKSGSPIRTTLSYLLRDYGIFVYQDSATGQYRFKLIREGETPTPITKDYFNESEADQVVSHNTLAPDKIMYSFVEAYRAFQTSTILISDDGNAKLSGDPNTKKQTLNTVTDIKSASIVASRLDQGLNTSEGLRLKVSSDLDYLEVGDLVALEDLAGSYRASSKKINPGDSEMELTVTQDVYSVTNNYTLFSSSGTSVPLALQPDVLVAAIEANRFISADVNGYYVIRARGASHIPFAGLYRSTDNTTFNSVSAMEYQTACELSEDLPDTSGGIIDSLTVTPLGDDFEAFWAVVNMTDAEWRAGGVCMLIGGEYLFPKSVTDLGGGSFRLNDIVRGRFGSPIESYTAGISATLFYLNQLPVFEDSTLLAGDTLYLKTRPYSTVEVMPLDYQNTLILDYKGGGFRPLPPENLNTVDDTNAWVSGTYADLRWDYKSVASGAGQQSSDEPTELSLPEGYFRITILNGTAVVRETDTFEPSFTYTQAMMSADFGSEPSTFNVEVVEILNGLTSDTDSATIYRV